MAERTRLRGSFAEAVADILDGSTIGFDGFAMPDLPVTARGAVTSVVTNYGLFEPIGSGFRLLEIAPGLTVDELRAATGGMLVVAEGLREVSLPHHGPAWALT